MPNAFCIQKSALKGTVAIPPSKSHSIRAILFATLAHGESKIENLLISPDVEAMIVACRQMGAKIDVEEGLARVVGVKGTPQVPNDVINAGNSGLVLRLIGAVAALGTEYTVLTGDRSIRENRPAQPLLDGLNGLGAFAISTRGNGQAPLVVRGPMLPGVTRLNGQDSQPVSALLIAAAFLEGITEIHVEHPGELPWIALTLNWFDRLGIHYENDCFQRYRVQGKACYSGFNMTIPGDFSSAAYPLAAAVLTDSEVTLSHLDMNDVQGDKKLISVLQEMGAHVTIDSVAHSVTIKKGSALAGRVIDVDAFIDAVPILAVIGCCAKGETRLVNGAIARKKECDRLAMAVAQLRKMGADIRETEDGLVIRESTLRGALVEACEDHRMGMALSVAAMVAEGESRIEGVDCIRKTYPDFFEHMKRLGARVKDEEETHGKESY